MFVTRERSVSIGQGRGTLANTGNKTQKEANLLGMEICYLSFLLLNWMKKISPELRPDTKKNANTRFHRHYPSIL